MKKKIEPTAPTNEPVEMPALAEAAPHAVQSVIVVPSAGLFFVSPDGTPLMGISQAEGGGGTLQLYDGAGHTSVQAGTVSGRPYLTIVDPVKGQTRIHLTLGPGGDGAFNVTDQQNQIRLNVAFPSEAPGLLMLDRFGAGVSYLPAEANLPEESWAGKPLN